MLVYLDDIKYLKNNEGNYLFDTRGNMFKVNPSDGRELERLGLIKFIEKSNGQQNSTGKKASQMLDRVYVPESNPVKKSSPL